MSSPMPGAEGATTMPDREPVRCLVVAASLRGGSLNGRLADLASQVIAEQGGTVTAAPMAEFVCPSYDQDVQDGEGFPPGALALHRALEASDAYVIASPEYNGAMPGLLKNAVDWVSRIQPQPFNGRHGLLLSASPSMIGGNRGLWSLRVPLEHLGSRVYPDMFSLAQAHTAFAEDGEIASTALAKRFRKTVAEFMDLVEADKHYPCAKKAWVEFLGQSPDPFFDREE
ncbi:MAG: NAD(P)H-dependent oxidoreductase [Gemmatimonadota bacterium]|nr:NAD(P)H-dependent oxidoreductase [Gemmatimonadota bacterium]